MGTYELLAVIREMYGYRIGDRWLMVYVPEYWLPGRLDVQFGFENVFIVCAWIVHV